MLLLVYFDYNFVVVNSNMFMNIIIDNYTC